MEKQTKKYSVAQYAKKIDVSRQWVLQLIAAGKLNAYKVGKAWIIEIEE